ncbi:MAG: hypothetical protein H7233_11780, partial [Pseudorhodobacter sp.]|nr:hypothetical protein [Frankiaceae bacterium]
MTWPGATGAAPRTDLPWLRHRSRPRPAAARPPGLSEFVAGHGHHPVRPSAGQPDPRAADLDLTTPATRHASPVRPAPARPGPRPRRVLAGRAEVLTPRAPTVTLTRVQSGVGALVVEAACSDAVGDLRLAAAYRLADGTTGLLRHTDGATTVPATGARPILLAQRHGFERLVVDLHRVRDLDRLVVLAFSASGGPLAWGG